MDDREPSRQSRKLEPDSHIPPPTDPYVTYQTPYPRRPSDEAQNPFIEFRRLADSAFSSFFSGLPRFLGTEGFKKANQAQAQEDFVKLFDEQARNFEDRIVEMARLRAEQAEGFRKQVEQEHEERRREEAQQHEEENERWNMLKRGLANCPGLQSGAFEPQKIDKSEADTELDLYDGIKAYEASAYRQQMDRPREGPEKCPWKDGQIDKKRSRNEVTQHKRDWFSGLGYDGKRRAKNIPPYSSTTINTSSTQDRSVEWQAYDDEVMDPFTHDDHVVPWLKLSPYSPLTLMNDDAWLDTFNEHRSVSVADGPLSDFPYDQAFEDLMSVHKTDRLPSLYRRFAYWGGPTQWMIDMVMRGSLGPKWEEGFMAAGAVGAVDGSQWKGFDGLKGECVAFAGREFAASPASDHCYDKEHDKGETKDHTEAVEDFPLPDASEWVKLAKAAFEPRMREVYEQIEETAQSLFGEKGSSNWPFGARGMAWPTPEEVISAIFEGGSDAEDSVSSDLENNEVTSASKSLHTKQRTLPKTVTEPQEHDHERENSLISTFTTTTTRTLPDGSVEMRRVLKKRFADGTEENSETTELKPARPSGEINQNSSNTVVDGDKGRQDKSGWFWN